jgi:hypothetical protein
MTQREHDHGALMPYLGLIGLFHAGLAAVVARGRKAAEPTSLVDLLLCGIAAHEASQLLTRDRVARPLREPFVEEVPGDDGAPEEQPRGSGMTHALGELMTCPYCAGPWLALAFMGLHQVAPSAARVATGVFVASAISDGLHHARHLLKSKKRELDVAGDVLSTRAELERMATSLE